MREIRPSGSEGGGDLPVSPYPYRNPRTGANPGRPYETRARARIRVALRMPSQPRQSLPALTYDL